MDTAAIVGATGPTGRHLAAELRRRGVATRAISRSQEHLDRVFGPADVERWAADATDAEALRRAIDGCEAVFDCIGLPAERMADHPRTARALAAAMAATGARGVHVSSYWSFLPPRGAVIDEQHPRSGGPEPVRLRREAEDILREAGAAIAHLPDFYGEHVHTSTLQNALRQAADGRAADWIGAADTAREYVYVPDAMVAVAELATREAAGGRGWIVPGAGTIGGAEVARIAGERLGRPVKLRAVGPLVLRLVSLFDRGLRGFMPLVPFYVLPLSFDGSRLRGLIGDVPATPYATGIARTLDWIGSAEG